MSQNAVKVDSDTLVANNSRVIVRFQSKHILLVVAIVFAALHMNADQNGWSEEARKRKADYIYMEALRQNAVDNEDAYYELMNRAYELDSTNSDVGFYVGYYKLAMSNKDSVLFHQGYNMMEKHFCSSPEDFYGSYLFGNVNEKLGMRKKALQVWAVLDSLFMDKTEIGMKYAESLAQSGDSANIKRAIDVYNRIEKAEGKNMTISTGKIRTHFIVRDTAAIITELHELLQSSPTSAEYNVFAGDIYSLFAQRDSALYYYNRACDLDSTSGLAYYTRANFYKEQGDSVAYDKEVFQALKQESLDLEAKLSLLTNYIRGLYEDPKQQPRIQDLFAVLLEQHPHEKDIHDLYCSYLVAIKDYIGAAEQAGYVLDSDPSNEDRWRATMSLYAQGNDFAKAVEVGEEALNYHPKSVLINLFIATNYNQLAQYDKSLAHLNVALEATDKADVELYSQVLCSIGDTYYMAEQTDSAFTYYDKSLDVDPGNLLALNNCAYYLACEGRALDRAERMSAITIQEEPQNDTSLDTYAWVLFKKKDYERAQHYIEEALKYSESPSAELYHHAGDIYFMMGDPDKALVHWEEALELAPDDELLQRKVLHKTYFYK